MTHAFSRAKHSPSAWLKFRAGGAIITSERKGKKERKEKKRRRKEGRRKRERLQEQNQSTYLLDRGSIAPIYLEQTTKIIH
jgi:hypothetical protein